MDDDKKPVAEETATDVHLKNIYHALTDVQAQVKEIASSVKKVDVHEEQLKQNERDHERFEKTMAGPRRLLYMVLAGVLIAGIVGMYSVVTTAPNVTVEISALALKQAIKDDLKGDE